MSNIIVTFSPRNIVGCLLKKGLQRGDHGHPRTPPLDTPLDIHSIKPGLTKHVLLVRMRHDSVNNYNHFLT